MVLRQKYLKTIYMSGHWAYITVWTNFPFIMYTITSLSSWNICPENLKYLSWDFFSICPNWYSQITLHRQIYRLKCFIYKNWPNWYVCPKNLEYITWFFFYLSNLVYVYTINLEYLLRYCLLFVQACICSQTSWHNQRFKYFSLKKNTKLLYAQKTWHIYRLKCFS